MFSYRQPKIIKTPIIELESDGIPQYPSTYSENV